MRKFCVRVGFPARACCLNRGKHARADGTRRVPATVSNTTLRVIRVFRDSDSKSVLLRG
ncbi:MAG: hypothetical protein OXI43_02375 [Candidatus Poribacteria bacterium]|nr:hypothetical protein [Candidatus Poribacteria bacterium]